MSIGLDTYTCCRTETEAADQTYHLTQRRCTDTEQTSPTADPITPGTGQGGNKSNNFKVPGMTRPGKKRVGEGLGGGRMPVSSALDVDALPVTRFRCHGGRRPSSDDSLHSPTVIPPSALDKPSIMKRYHRRRTCSHTSPRRSPTMVTLHDTRLVECRWWNDGWTVKTVVT